jgi:hypothetical protein
MLMLASVLLVEGLVISGWYQVLFGDEPWSVTITFRARRN